MFGAPSSIHEKDINYFFLKYEINNEHCASSNSIENGNFIGKKKKKVKSEQKNIK